MTNLRSVVLLIAAATLAPSLAMTADWPNRPIHFIVPFPAGGSTDVAARVVGDYLSRTLGQQVVVENKSGANGNIGIEYAAKAVPDGYTVLVATDAISSNPHVYKMDFDPLKELTPVVELSHQPIALAAHPSLGIKTLAELTAMAKQQPGMRFATGSGVGSLQGMVALWYAKLAGIVLEQVPYRGGAPAINDLIAGHVKLGSLGTTPLIPHYKAGALRLLAQSMATRSAALPDVPTFQEAGMTGLVVDQRIGMFVPVGTPSQIIARLNAEANAALKDEKIRQTFADQAQEPAGGTAERYGTLVRNDSDKYGRLAKDLNIKVE
ncbi:MAG TPA: tripartite tricarboxylate transporter substrate binding protein [Xanthobacteraceae bacterium]|nr:tripartite tricarboxylate transporter substrate binding protein [Xanthobacteraceae bacterium]